MDILAGLRSKLRFIERHYSAASETFREIKRKIRDHEDPFQPPYFDPDTAGCPILALFARVGIFRTTHLHIPRLFLNLNPHPLKCAGAPSLRFLQGWGFFGLSTYSPVVLEPKPPPFETHRGRAPAVDLSGGALIRT
jgi:hypothetical protein